MSSPYHVERENMVEFQIIRRGVDNPEVCRAMKTVPRHRFVPSDLRSRAYADSPLPIGHGQTISQPYIVAYMTERLGISAKDRVLEIGTGSGYQTAVLAEIARHVFSMEVHGPLSERADGILGALGYVNVSLRVGDGSSGWPEEAPFDAIMVTAAPPEIPMELIGQLKVGGKMILPVGEFFQYLVLIERREQGYREERLLAVRFVPMIGAINAH